MMLKELKDNTIASYQPEVRTGRKWNAKEEAEICIMSLEHRDNVRATCKGRKGIGGERFKPFSCMSQRQHR